MSNIKYILLIVALFVIGGIAFAIVNFWDINAFSGKAGLQISTNDVPATVLLNQENFNKTPLIVKDLKPGRYQITIQPDDPALQSYETELTLRKGLLTVITWQPAAKAEQAGGVILELSKLENQNQSQISVITIPDGAIVSLDGGAKEFGPVIYPNIAPGTHEVEITLPSYELQKHTINVVDNHLLTITAKLAKLVDSEATTSATPIIANSTNTKPDLLASSSATITIQKTNFFQAGKEVVRVRSNPSSAASEIGFANVGESYPYTGETKDGWYQINLGGKIGWISAQFAKLN